MEANPTLAAWLVARRPDIERSMLEKLGPAAPRASGPEAETLRRFRTWTGAAVGRADFRPPPLDGLAVNDRRVSALLDAWVATACELAGPDAPTVEAALKPLSEQFRASLQRTSGNRGARGKPRASRRAVIAAIDRIADAFLAIDTVACEIADANPAAGALLGTARDALIGVPLDAFLPPDQVDTWHARLEAMGEGGDHERFVSTLNDVAGTPVRVDVGLTAYPVRGRSLALAVCRPGVTRDEPIQSQAQTPNTAKSQRAPMAWGADGRVIARRDGSQKRRRAAPTHPRPPGVDGPPAGSGS